ncbi:MAG: DUF3141 domain-containing protein [Gammaproteobacteria bacterium]
MTNSSDYGVEHAMTEGNKALARAGRQATDLAALASRHWRALAEQQMHALRGLLDDASAIATAATGSDLLRDASAYLEDGGQRAVLFWDIMRRAGNIHREHADSGAPPVLVYDYEMLIDGRKLDRPVNYALVRIKPEDGVPADPTRRPYIIIDPRAGHGAGIGGSKSDSQVGVAMRAGHPVYFVIFFPDPEPGQDLADICAAEGDFIRAVCERHPHAPKPVIVGNCQGGWSTMLVSAANPDLTGPIVINGAPMSYWAGERGKNPMRYFGGLAGGVIPAALSSDLGGGRFDGANLVLNFESLNPANTWWSKYYDLYRDVDEGDERFLDFERWWSGFYFMNANEIRWIVENLFIGNRLARGGVMLDPHTYVNVRHIRSPIIVFASFGDNITPPQQALNWIADAYRDTHEIKAAGQRIVYLLHDEIGHLGIFVSSQVAQKQHRQIVSTLKAVETLSPGLYEMVLTDKSGEGEDAVYTVTFESREIEDILEHDDERDDEEMFAAISRVSRLSGEVYDLAVRPWLKPLVNPLMAQANTSLHPLRLRRSLVSDANPALGGLGAAAEQVRAERRPVAEDNVFVRWERLYAGMIEQGLAQYRAWTDACLELSFHAIYGSPPWLALGEEEREYETSLEDFDIHRMPQVQLILGRVGEGGFVDGVVRMLVLMAEARHGVRQTRLERADEIMRGREPFSDLSDSERARVVHEQSVIVDLVPDVAVATLPLLLEDDAARREALELVDYVVGTEQELDEDSLAMRGRIRDALVIAEPAARLTA